MVKDINEIIDSFKKQVQGAPEVDEIAGIRRLPSPKDIEKVVKWYESNRCLYEELAEEVEKIIKSNLKAEKIVVHDIVSRAKTVESYKKKSSKYSDPINQIKDNAGIRVICFVPQDVDKVCNIIKKIFFIDNVNSIDKSSRLEVDQVGYRSIHYIAKYDYDRTYLPENQKFIDLFFEIQVRTILQHAWAEFEHDRNYKFNGVLPEEIKRRFYLLAGTLELMDREFNSLAKDIENHEKQVKKQTELGDFNLEIDETSLNEYLRLKFKECPISLLTNNDKTIIEDLKRFGVKTISNLEKVIPEDFIQAIKETSKNVIPLSAILLYLMIINDSEKYFKNASSGLALTIDTEEKSLFEKYFVPIKKLAEQDRIFFIDDDGNITDDPDLLS